MKKITNLFKVLGLTLISTFAQAQQVTVSLSAAQAQHFEAVQDNFSLAYISISPISNSNLYFYEDPTSPNNFHSSFHRYKFNLPTGVVASDVTSVTISYNVTVTAYNIGTLIWNTIPNSSCNNSTTWGTLSMADYETTITCMKTTTSSLNQVYCSNVGANNFSQTITSSANAQLLAGLFQGANNFTIATFVDGSQIGQTTSSVPVVSLTYNTHPIANNTISSSSTSFVCSGTPATLTGTTPTGGTPGVYTYQWQSSINAGGTWTNISGATGINYTPSAAISQTTYYRRIVNSATQPASTSNNVIVTINPPAVPTGVVLSNTQSPNTLQLSWNASASATSYQVTNCLTNVVTNYASSPVTLSGLTAATNYQYSVKAVCGGGTSAASPCASATTLQNISNNIICCAQTQTGVAIPAFFSGTVPTGGTGAYTYSWESSLNGSTWTSLGITTQNYTPSANITQTTYYRRNVVSGTQSVYSNTVTVTVTAPAAPTGANITALSSSSLQMNWAGSVGATGYNIYNCTTGVLVGTVTAPTTSYVITGLNSYTAYQYYVTAICGTTLTSPNSACASGTTLTNPIANNTISSNTSFVCSATSFNINGTTPTNGNNTTYTYQWQKSTDNINWVNVTGTGTGINYTETAVITQTTYYRRVVSSSPAASSTSNTVTITIGSPVTPTGVVLFSASNTSLQMNWNASPGATFYQVVDCSLGIVTTVNAPLTTVVISGLTTATQYQYKIIACCGLFSSAASACFTGTPGACYSNAGSAVTDQNISCCGGCSTTGVQIGTTPPVSGLTYQWSPITTLLCPTCPVTTTTFCSSIHGVGTFSLTVSGPNCATSTSTVLVRTSSFTGVSCCRIGDYQDETVTTTGHTAFSIYPNPTNNEVTISLYDNADYVKITDVTGRIVFETNNVTKSELKLNVSNYVAGLYFVIAKIGDNFEKKKLIVE